MIKRFAPVLVLASVIAVSCKKTNTGCAYTFFNATASDSEVAVLRDSLQSHSIYNFTADPSGMFYNIVNGGTGDMATGACSQVTVSYTGRLLSGLVFDSTAPNETTTVTLGQLIEGWQKAIPLVKAGGEIIAYVSPTLGYGSQVITDSQGQVLIPANSDLIFDINVVSVKNP
ncbi:MAG TPA: FKBP-type peptidyl-prolyl cis-trans isomerase [Chitinophagaceae bacterium]|nr:FKBP-type peptidyl-prolyl cis-trans isomerase [Chitinophagaceae bacterium]